MHDLEVHCRCGCGKKIPYLTEIGNIRKYVHGHNGKGKKRFFSKKWIENIRNANIGKRYSEVTKEKKRLIALKRNPINTGYFKKLGKRNAYVLGYLFADGHLRKSKSSYGYALSIFSKDKELIDNLKDEFLIQHRKTKISSYKSIKYYGLQINNYHFLKYLKNLGLKVGKKSNRILIPNKITKNRSLSSNFCRGFFDGDGWISSFKLHRTPTVTFVTSSFKFLLQFRQGMKRLDITSGKIRKANKTKAFRLSFYGKENVYNLYKLMYQNNNNLFLSRKKQRFDEYFKAYNWKTI